MKIVGTKGLTAFFMEATIQSVVFTRNFEIVMTDETTVPGGQPVDPGQAPAAPVPEQPATPGEAPNPIQ